MSVSFAGEEALIHRLTNATIKGEKFTFLIGSGLTAPMQNLSKPGVSAASSIVQSIGEVLNRGGYSKKKFEKIISLKSVVERYQSAMQLLLEYHGQNELNNIIIKAVLKARMDSDSVIPRDEAAFTLLEGDVEGWYLNPGVAALGELYSSLENIGPILTSNFDPLIQISIKKSKGIPETIFLTNDGLFDNIISSTKKVVHFHGYWYQGDTLHTPEQINRKRPQLSGSLRKLLSDTTLVVIGYGGWNDVFTKTLIDVASEGASKFNILWTFYSKEKNKIESNNAQLLKRLSHSIGQRVVLYSGINAHEFFPNLLKSISQKNLMERKTISKEEIKQLIASSRKDNLDNKPDEIFSCDTPPNTTIWVGRENELSDIASNYFKVIFITGIGGQGKSALAAHYVKNHSNEVYELWDWRDCKEEDNRIHTKLISIIERLSNGEIRNTKLANAKIEDLIDIFFDVLDSKRAVFVFDNIDQYIDLEQFLPTRGIGYLVEEALKRKHNSKFIFTCRPKIKISSSDFLLVPIEGLTVVETINLFYDYKPPLRKDKLEKIAKELHELTNGHPLWLTIAAAQATRGEGKVIQFINGIRANKEGMSLDLAENTLKTVWNTLNHKDQCLLRGMSEIVRAETEDNLAKMLESELNYNQFSKSLRTLKSLNLIVIKSSANKPDLLELHPLVQEFIRNKYPKKDREKYITLLINFYNEVIVIYKPRLKIDSPFEVFENWTNKIELDIHNESFKSALVSMQEIYSSLIAAGYIEEYIRISTLFYQEIDWVRAITEEYSYFHEQFGALVKILVEFGDVVKAKGLLDKYSSSISGKGIHYLLYCELQCYFFWFQNKFSDAIYWGNKGVTLKTASKVDVKINIDYTLALALRDSKIRENIKKALSTFLRGESIENISSDKFIDKNLNSADYGNVGRCLLCLGDAKRALICYRKSLNLLFGETSSNTVLNKGYACKWIAELFNKLNPQKSYYFYKLAYIYWVKTSKPRLKDIKKELTELELRLKPKTALTEWDLEELCRKEVAFSK